MEAGKARTRAASLAGMAGGAGGFSEGWGQDLLQGPHKLLSHFRAMLHLSSGLGLGQCEHPPRPFSILKVRALQGEGLMYFK